MPEELKSASGKLSRQEHGQRAWARFAFGGRPSVTPLRSRRVHRGVRGRRACETEALRRRCERRGAADTHCSPLARGRIAMRQTAVPPWRRGAGAGVSFSPSWSPRRGARRASSAAPAAPSPWQRLRRRGARRAGRERALPRCGRAGRPDLVTRPPLRPPARVRRPRTHPRPRGRPSRCERRRRRDGAGGRHDGGVDEDRCGGHGVHAHAGPSSATRTAAAGSPRIAEEPALANSLPRRVGVGEKEMIREQFVILSMIIQIADIINDNKTHYGITFCLIWQLRK
ncbi:Protein of unknown function [Gryllus bimaculatus]|nr:Protein of unknown function [Gryllus bimaculatus]